MVSEPNCYVVRRKRNQIVMLWLNIDVKCKNQHTLLKVNVVYKCFQMHCINESENKCNRDITEQWKYTIIVILLFLIAAKRILSKG